MSEDLSSQTGLYLKSSMIELVRLDEVRELLTFPYCIPLIGQLAKFNEWRRRAAPLIKQIEEVLCSRPKYDQSIWGEDMSAQRTGALFCDIAWLKMGWPNNRFLPGDDFAVVYWAHVQGLDYYCAIDEIRRYSTCEITDDEVETWATMNLGQVVERTSKMLSAPSEASTGLWDVLRLKQFWCKIGAENGSEKETGKK